MYIISKFVVIGYERKRGAAPMLLLAEETDARLRHVGNAGPSIGGKQRDELWQALESLHTGHFATPVGAGNKAAVPAGVEPVLKVMAKHLRGEEKLRHANDGRNPQLLKLLVSKDLPLPVRPRFGA